MKARKEKCEYEDNNGHCTLNECMYGDFLFIDDSAFETGKYCLCEDVTEFKKKEQKMNRNCKDCDFVIDSKVCELCREPSIHDDMGIDEEQIRADERAKMKKECEYLLNCGMGKKKSLEHLIKICREYP